MARVVEAEFATTTHLSYRQATEAWVTAAEDLAGIRSSYDLADRLTLMNTNGALSSGPKLVIEFDTVTEGLASPVFRSNPGFVGGGRTAGGAREFVMPNLPLSELRNVKTRVVP
jgi:hypothetical protein